VRFTQLGEIGARWSLLAAATLIVAGPILVVFLIFQRRFIQSFMHSGFK
jgi:sn-glycerol 3-phosphate transport system permease protein